ncbi:hypothetical protein BJX70DRAFT_397263 [Aspergillus crustosus]
MSNLTLAIIGCGNMGTAILNGLLDSTSSSTSESPSQPPIKHIIATTKTPSSATKLQSRFSTHPSSHPITLTFLPHAATTAATQAEIVILGCKPYLVDEVLVTPGLADALAGKLVVSIIAGKTLPVLSESIKKNQTETTSSKVKEKEKEEEKGTSGNENGTIVARAIPNIAASVNESMTMIETPESISPEQTSLITYIFSSIGKTKILPPPTLRSGFHAHSLNRNSLRRRRWNLRWCLIGLGRLLQEGHHPAVLRENIASLRGCTIQGLLAIEQGGVRGAFAEGVMRGTGHLRKLQE